MIMHILYVDKLVIDGVDCSITAFRIVRGAAPAGAVVGHALQPERVGAHLDQPLALLRRRELGFY